MYRITLTSVSRRSIQTVWHSAASPEQAAEELRFWKRNAGSTNFVTLTIGR